MEIVENLGELRSDRGTAVTIGVYDGVHIGHQKVLQLLRELADARNLDAVCITFDRHPAEVVRPESAPKLLTTLDQKLELLDATGLLDRCFVLHFDEARSREPAEDFVREAFVEGAGAKLVVVGADFHFGRGRGGNVALLERMGVELGFAVVGLGLEAAPGGVVYSSTRIRELLQAGDVVEAAALLGRPHEVRGQVQVGDRRGRELGFPTANLMVPSRVCLPADGIYAGTFLAEDGVERAAAISLGRRATFNEHAQMSLLEAFVLDFDGDLYDQEVKVRFVARLRGEERFESAELLIEQMKRDVEETRRLLV
jgi:riboflavin kinase/FMN adenylyltransferase